MHYPWWHVPLLTAPMLIAAIAVVHVLVSHYAVGGGLFLAVETQYAYRAGNRGYLEYLRGHAWFFVLLTVAFGAITGVGIWWIIGLASPLATETLIHVFVFGWAMEYVFFLLEIAAAFIFFYYWGRLRPAVHVQIGWIYAGAAWISLVLITGITAFMLHPGGWVENQNFWVGFLNPQFLPQVLARTGGALLLTALYVYLHAAVQLKDTELRALIGRRSARPALLGAALVTIGGLWWLAALPQSALAALIGSAPLNLLMAAVLGLSVVIFAMIYLGPWRNPAWITPGFGILLLACGMTVVAAGEFLREAVRKPYISYNVVLSNQVLAEEVAQLQKTGYLEGGVWTSAWIGREYPQVLDGEAVVENRLLLLPEADQAAVGQVLFQYHCNDCHASRLGLSPVAELMRGWEREDIARVVANPDKARFVMPPWCGTPAEAEVLTTYLETISAGYPPGMYYGGGGGEE